MTVTTQRPQGDGDTAQRQWNPPRRALLPAGTGLAVAVALPVLGLALIALTWARVSELTNTAQQIPYVVSGGLTGLALVVLGSAVLVVVTRHGDDQVRAQQAEELAAALRDLAEAEREAGR